MTRAFVGGARALHGFYEPEFIVVSGNFSADISRMNRKLRGLLVLCLLATSACGQVWFTVTATANDNNLGYGLGQSYNFAFTTGSSFANTSSSSFLAGTRNLWSEEVTSDDQLWASIGGSGLGGSFVRPTSLSTDPSSAVRINSPNELLLAVGTNAFGGTIGLTTPNGSAINGIEFLVTLDSATFVFPGAHTEPNSYFSNYYGTYSSVTPFVARIFGPAVFSGSQAEFAITSVTIGSAAIPEPSTYALILGLLTLGFAATRCRRKGQLTDKVT